MTSPKSFLRRESLVGGALLLLLTGITLGGFPAQVASADEAIEPVPAHIRVRNAIAEFTALHPNDFIGLNRAIVEAGGDPVRFTFDKAELSDLTPEQAQAAYDAAQVAAVVEDAGIATPSIPTDAFSVSGYWSHVSDSDGEWYSYYGSWDFRNTYGSGDNPDDAMAVQTKYVSPSCFVFDGDGAWAKSQNGGDRTYKLARKGVDFDSSVWTVDDSAGTANVDRGTAYINYKRARSCASTTIYGKTFYEHNIDGCNCTWTYSVGIDGFSISYSTTDLPVARQKYTTLIRTST